MRRYWIFPILFFLTPMIAHAEDQQACFGVEGMTCAACTVTLKAAVKKLDGIKKVTASVEDKKAVVTFDVSKTNAESIKSKIDSTGYKATVKQCKV